MVLPWFVDIYVSPYFKKGTREVIERTHLVRMTIGVDEETGEPYTKEEFVKPLTDEEILEIWNQHSSYGAVISVYDFARAILRKANEK